MVKHKQSHSRDRDYKAKAKKLPCIKKRIWKKYTLEQIEKALVDINEGTSVRPGYSWYRLFMKRHPRLA